MSHERRRSIPIDWSTSTGERKEAKAIPDAPTERASSHFFRARESKINPEGTSATFHVEKYDKQKLYYCFSVTRISNMQKFQ